MLHTAVGTLSEGVVEEEVKCSSTLQLIIVRKTEEKRARGALSNCSKYTFRMLRHTMSNWTLLCSVPGMDRNLPLVENSAKEREGGRGGVDVALITSASLTAPGQGKANRAASSL